MKKLMLTLALFAAIGIANAQTDQGGWLVASSSSLSYTSHSFDGGWSFSIFQLEAKTGYFFAENLAAGINLAYFNFDGSSSTSVGPFARYYVNGGFFLGAGYDAISSSGISAGFLNFEGGYPIFVADNISIDPGVSYSLGTGDNDGMNVFTGAFGFTFYF